MPLRAGEYMTTLCSASGECYARCVGAVLLVLAVGLLLLWAVALAAPDEPRSVLRLDSSVAHTPTPIGRPLLHARVGTTPLPFWRGIWLNTKRVARAPAAAGRAVEEGASQRPLLFRRANPSPPARRPRPRRGPWAASAPRRNRPRRCRPPHRSQRPARCRPCPGGARRPHRPAPSRSPGPSA